MLLASEALSYWASIDMAVFWSVTVSVKSPREEDFFSVLPVMSHLKPHV